MYITSGVCLHIFYISYDYVYMAEVYISYRFLDNLSKRNREDIFTKSMITLLMNTFQSLMISYIEPYRNTRYNAIWYNNVNVHWK